MQSRKRWLAFASLPRGGIVVDAGAKGALVLGGKSLLPAGVRRTDKTFRAGDVVSLVDLTGQEFGRGLTNYSRDEVEKIKGLRSDQISEALGHKSYDEVIHRDNLVILEAPPAAPSGRGAA
jgi:glutamate 5-kinase